MTGVAAQRHSVFVTGGTGYIGSRTVAALVERGHDVHVLVRTGSRVTIPRGLAAVRGDALDRSTYQPSVTRCDTFLHLVGVSHPSPSKAQQFRDIDLAAAREAIAAARESGIRHFVYISVAHPSPVMKAFVEVRIACEEMLLASGLPATILRPWYVLGPGHRWPYMLVPLYWLAEPFPWTHDTAVRLGLVTIDQMVHALVQAIEDPATGTRILEVPQIRESRLSGEDRI